MNVERPIAELRDAEALAASDSDAAEMRWVDERDPQLWSIVAMVALVAVMAVVALVLPNLAPSWGSLRADTRYLPPLFFGLTALVVLFNVYILEQRRRVRLSRQQLLEELVKRQNAERLLLVDPLTETFNRRYLDEVLDRDLKRAERQGVPLTFMMIDVDHFKSVNTRFGHLMGDKVLVEVAQILRRTFRASDTIIRYGGDEFLIVLEGSTREQAEYAVKRLQRHVQAWNDSNVMVDYQMGLSSGIAPYEPGRAVADVMNEADAAMYRMKDERRAKEAEASR